MDVCLQDLALLFEISDIHCQLVVETEVISAGSARKVPDVMECRSLKCAKRLHLGFRGSCGPLGG